MTSVKEIFREVREINRKSVFLDQANIVFPKGEDNPLDIDVILTPVEGPFRGGRIVFNFKLPDTYPAKVPHVTCKTVVLHPNISFDGNICFSMLGGEGWCEQIRLEQFINGLLWLLANPNMESALNGTAYEKDKHKYERNVQWALRGLPVRGVKFAYSMDPQAVPSESMERRLAMMFDFLFEKTMSAMKPGQKPPTEPGFKQFATVADVLALGPALPEGDFVEALKLVPEAQVLRRGVRCSVNVESLARMLKVDHGVVMKELVWEAAGRAVVTVSAGRDGIDPDKLAAVVGVQRAELKPMSGTEIARRLSFPAKAVPSFGHSIDRVAEVVIDASVAALADDTVVYVTAGVRGCLLSMTAAQFRKALNARPTIRASILAERPAAQPIVPASPAPDPLPEAPVSATRRFAELVTEGLAQLRLAVRRKPAAPAAAGYRSETDDESDADFDESDDLPDLADDFAVTATAGKGRRMTRRQSPNKDRARSNAGLRAWRTATV